jgi:hypothetical protein
VTSTVLLVFSIMSPQLSLVPASDEKGMTRSRYSKLRAFLGTGPLG